MMRRIRGLLIDDTHMVNFLERLNAEKKYSGRCILRMSKSGRGWRLHETSAKGGRDSVRDAIIDVMEREWDKWHT